MRLRILLIMDPFIRVPPEHYGGIERVIADVADGLHRRSHEVTLWAAPSSQTAVTVEPFGREGEWTRWSNLRNTASLTARFWSRPGRFDVIHNFGRLAYLIGILRSKVPKVQTYMRQVNPNNMRRVLRLGGRHIRFTAVSRAIRDTGAPGGGPWEVVYNCVPIEQYHLRTDVDPSTAPLVFLGRLESIKGVHNAIAVAKATHRKLIIAGNRVATADGRRYFERQIAPYLDGKQIVWVGPVNDGQKDAVLGAAAALLMLIEWDEPFGIVMPEAFACGTPVVGFARGSVPEVIRNGINGYVCRTVDDATAAICKLSEIDRSAVRADCEARFSDRAITASYERLYLEMI
ncbi:MAG: glycosyltransferase [Candidatus Binatia bacterium]